MYNNLLNNNIMKDSSTKYKIAIVVLILLSISYYITQFFIESNIFFYTLHNDAMEYNSIRPLTLYKSYASEMIPQIEEKSAYAFLALGPQALQMNCPAAIESLSRIGGWKNDIYLIKKCQD